MTEVPEGEGGVGEHFCSNTTLSPPGRFRVEMGHAGTCFINRETPSLKDRVPESHLFNRGLSRNWKCKWSPVPGNKASWQSIYQTHEQLF